MEDILEGLNENADEMEKKMKGEGQVETLEGDDAINFLLHKD